jgi:uncharacterized MAPEG superfamily protein
MSTELTLLAWTLVLALVQILLPATLRMGETGLPYNASPRDQPSPAPVGKLTGRLLRAQSNLFETLPLFAAAVLIAHVGGRENASTLLGAQLYLAARLVYVPLYAFGVPYLRTAAWGTGFLGLVLILTAILR